MADNNWKKIKLISEIKSKWLTILVEQYLDDQKKQLEYWRVQKPDVILIVVIHNNHLILPKPSYRPGIQKSSLDLCGGRRSSPNSQLLEDAQSIVKRELQIEKWYQPKTIQPINHRSYNLDSSFSNVKTHLFFMELASEQIIPQQLENELYDNNLIGINKLLAKIDCLQCRLCLQEYKAFV